MNKENNQPENIEPAAPNKKCHRSRKIRFIIPLVILGLILTSVFGIVYAKKKFRDGPDGFLMGMIADKLNLTDTQKAQVEQLRNQIKEKMESKKSERDNMMEEFGNEFKKDNMDKSKLTELDQKREQEQKETKDFMIDKMIEFHNILTPEQRIKAVDTMKEMKEKFHGMHDKDGNDKNNNKNRLK